MKDESGYLAIIDGLIAIILIFSVFLIFNLILNVPENTYTVVSHENTVSQDVMQQLDTNINLTDKTFLEEISAILDKNKHSKKSIREVSKLCEAKFNQLGLKNNYLFKETNVGFDIIEKGNYQTSQNVSTSSRNCGDYCFKLYVW